MPEAASGSLPRTRKIYFRRPRSNRCGFGVTSRARPVSSSRCSARGAAVSSTRTGRPGRSSTGGRRRFDDVAAPEEPNRLDRQLALREALNEISSSCRRLLAAYYVEGRTLRDASHSVALAVSAVPKTLSRCLERLRRMPELTPHLDDFTLLLFAVRELPSPSSRPPRSTSRSARAARRSRARSRDSTPSSAP